MPICIECGKEFPNRVKVNGQIKVVHKRLHCMECVPFGSGRKKTYHISSKKSNDRVLTEKGLVICSWCGQEKNISEFYKSKKRGEEYIQPHCKECQKIAMRKRWIKIKNQCVDYKGSECEVCGYNKCIAALDFHHRDPTKKDFQLSNTRWNFSKKDWEKIKKEMDKCILVCSNCHREIHYKGITETEINHDNLVFLEKSKEKYRTPTSICPICGKDVYGRSKYCSKECGHISLRRADWPSKKELKIMIDTMSWSAIARKYGVVDNTVRKWAKKYNLLSP